MKINASFSGVNITSSTPLTKEAVEAAPGRPAITVDWSRIPRSMRSHARWFPWSYQRRDNHWVKRPLVRRGPLFLLGSHTARLTWTTFEEAAGLVAVFEALAPVLGLGFELTADDPFFVVDLDDSRDPVSGAIRPWAQAIIDRLATYTEVSPSGTGVKIFGIGRKPGTRCHVTFPTEGGAELYDCNRFVALTGQRLPGTPAELRDCQPELDAIYAEWFPADPKRDAKLAELLARRPAAISDVSDAELLRKATAAPYGDRLQALWNGDTSSCDHDASRADYALARALAFWCGPDVGRIVSLMWQSGLARDKWRSRPGYLTQTVERAISGRQSFYGDGSYRGRREEESYELTPEAAALVDGMGRRPAAAAAVADHLPGAAKMVDDLSDLARPLPPDVAAELAADTSRHAAARQAVATAEASERPQATTCRRWSVLCHEDGRRGRVMCLACKRWSCLGCAKRHKTRWTAHLVSQVLGSRVQRLHIGEAPADRRSWDTVSQQITRRGGDYATIDVAAAAGHHWVIATKPFTGSTSVPKVEAVKQLRDKISRIQVYGDTRKPISTTKGWRLPRREPSGWHVLGGLDRGTSWMEVHCELNRLGVEPEYKRSVDLFVHRVAEFAFPDGLSPGEFYDRFCVGLLGLDYDAAAATDLDVVLPGATAAAAAAADDELELPLAAGPAG